MFGKTLAQSFESRADIEWIEMHVEEAERFFVAESGMQRLIQFPFRADFESPAAAEQIGQSMIVPVENIVEGAILNESLGGVTFVVEHDDDGIEIVPQNCREFEAGHLKGAIAYENNRPEIFAGDLDT